jgi:hypothetical protein
MYVYMSRDLICVPHFLLYIFKVFDDSCAFFVAASSFVTR